MSDYLLNMISYFVFVKIEKWFGKKKQLAAVRTISSHIQNLFKGVTYVRAIV